MQITHYLTKRLTYCPKDYRGRFIRTTRMASLRLCRRQLWTHSQTSSSTSQILRSLYSTTTTQDREQASEDNFHKWVTLPPFSPQMDASSIGKEIAGRNPIGRGEPITALKWVRCCCPQLPMSLVQKLFRLRQVRFRAPSVCLNA